MRRRAALWPLLVLVGFIAAIAFILSFDALRTLGVACGIDRSLAWMFPLIVDLPVIAFTWATWVFKTRGLGQAYPWLMLLLFSIVSLTGNALHAHPTAVGGMTLPQWGASLLMTMPSVALLATSHMIVRAAAKSYDDDATGGGTGEDAMPEVTSETPSEDAMPVVSEADPVAPNTGSAEPSDGDMSTIPEDIPDDAETSEMGVGDPEPPAPVESASTSGGGTESDAPAPAGSTDLAEQWHRRMHEPLNAVYDGMRL